MTRKVLPLLTLLACLSACGKYGDLEPKKGKTLPPAGYGQEQKATPEELLTPSIQQRPGRSDELLRHSERRDDDPFDLPPGSETAVSDEDAKSAEEGESAAEGKPKNP
ncbi:MAG: hypothetical protein V3V15_00055 [Sphingorhabdus sp.]